jgi:hypothetical protein
MSENKSSNGNKRAKRDSQPGAAQGGVRITAQGEVGESRSDLVASAQPASETAIVPSPAGPVVQPPTAQASVVAIQSMNGRDVIEDEFGGVGEGLEGIGAADMVMPAIAVMQGQSPEVKESGGKIKDGDFLIKSTGQVIDGKTGFLFIACGFKHAFNHWNNRVDEQKMPAGNGKGFIKEHLLNSDLVMKLTMGQKVFGPVLVDETPGQATSLVETKTIFGLIIDLETGAYQFATLPCSSSKIAAYNNVATTIRNTRVKGRPLNAYNFVWRVTTAQKKKKGTNNYYADLQFAPAFEPFLAPESHSLLTSNSDPNLFAVARQLAQDVAAQRVKAETHVDDTVPEANDTGDADRGKYTGQQRVDDQDIPF